MLFKKLKSWLVKEPTTTTTTTPPRAADPSNSPKIGTVDRIPSSSSSSSSPPHKILHLGASESGKSTILKSFIQTVQGDALNGKAELYRRVIFGNMIRSMQGILEEMKRLDTIISLADDDDDSSNEYHHDVQIILAQPRLLEPESLSKEAGSAIQCLWKDENVRKTLLRFRHDMYVDCPATDCAAYYFNSIDRISQPEYQPSALDILYAHKRTTSIYTTNLTFNNHDYQFWDVGGARNHRKTWIHCFADKRPAAILFTVDIASYDQVLYEHDPTTGNGNSNSNSNRMDEALALFKSLVRSKFFVGDTPLILVFTKLDRLESKLTLSPPETYFPDYYEGGRGGDDASSASAEEAFVSYITDRFVALNNEQAEENRKRLVVRYTSIHSSSSSGSGDDLIGRFLLKTIQEVVTATDIENVEPRLSNFAINFAFGKEGR